MTLIFVFAIAACAPLLVGPGGRESSLIMGKVVVENRFAGALSGLLPIGRLEKGLDLEIESRDGQQTFKVTTQDDGYFFIPNLASVDYHLVSVVIEGGRSSGEKERYALRLRRPVFTPVLSKVTYIGSLYLNVSDRGDSNVTQSWEADQAKAYFLRVYGSSPWSSREFVSFGPGATAQRVSAPTKTPAVLSQASAPSGPEVPKPEWQLGHEWRYAWKSAGRSGTYTLQVLREELFEGIPCYVIRNGKSEDFYVKDVLGFLARKQAGKVIFKRSDPRITFSWPLQVGKQWRNSYVRENVEERSSEAFEYRMVVTKSEQVKVAAGEFQAFKVEVYTAHNNSLFAEYWYAPKAKTAIKEREFLNDGLREAELIEYKLD